MRMNLQWYSGCLPQIKTTSFGSPDLRRNSGEKNRKRPNNTEHKVLSSVDTKRVQNKTKLNTVVKMYSKNQGNRVKIGKNPNFFFIFRPPKNYILPLIFFSYSLLYTRSRIPVYIFVKVKLPRRLFTFFCLHLKRISKWRFCSLQRQFFCYKHWKNLKWIPFISSTSHRSYSTLIIF